MLTYTIDFDLAQNSPARMVRQKVFMEEQGFENEFDEQDHDSWHFVFYEDGVPVGTCRMFWDQDRPKWMVLGRVAILPAFRGKHYGLKMTKIVEEEAKKLGAEGIWLSAQQRVQGFYEKGHYQASGAVYMDEHCPHIHMEKIL